LISAGCSPTGTQNEDVPVTINAPALIGKSRADVDSAMGAEPVCHEERSGTSCEYRPYKSAYFVDGKAANLTLPAVEDLRTYGLNLGEPDVKKPGYEHWQTKINGRNAEVSRFADYVHILTGPA
jgi:hypothetical protein